MSEEIVSIAHILAAGDGVGHKVYDEIHFASDERLATDPARYPVQFTAVDTPNGSGDRRDRSIERAIAMRGAGAATIGLDGIQSGVSLGCPPTI